MCLDTIFEVIDRPTVGNFCFSLICCVLSENSPANILQIYSIYVPSDVSSKDMGPFVLPLQCV